MALSLAYTHMVFFCKLETHSAFYISLILVTPRDVNSHQCLWTYSTILPQCQGRGEEKHSEREKTMSLMQICHQLAADQKSSIGRRSTESTGASSLCQAPASLRQMSTEGPGSRQGVCVSAFYVYVWMCIFGGGEVWAHAQCLKARIWHFEMSPESQKQKNKKRMEKV